MVDIKSKLPQPLVTSLRPSLPRYFHSLWLDPSAPPLTGGFVDEELQALVGRTVTAGEVAWVLDVGAGAGASRDVVSHPTARRVAVDISAVPLAGKAAECGVLPVVADGGALPFADGRFDVVTVIDVLSVAERPAALLSEAARVLRSGGTLIVNAQTLADDTRADYRLVGKEQGTELRAGSRFFVRFFDPLRLDDLLSAFPLEIIERAHYELTHHGHWYHPARHAHRYVALILRRI